MSTNASARWITYLRWMTRALSLVIGACFLVILLFAVANEDQPQTPAIGVMALVVLAMAACLVAWRWEKTGGVAVVVCAFGLGAAAYSLSRTVGLGSQSILPALIYGVPFLVVGTLFYVCGRGATPASTE